MAYRIRNFDNFSVERVNEIFRRGRGLGQGGTPVDEGEDFISNPFTYLQQRPMPPVEVVDDELESVR